jgi:hypothetical protein
MTAKSPFTQLRIASPCNQDWDTMIGNDRVRFCEHCQLSVHNLNLASRKQVRRLIARSGDRLCVSYSQPVPPRVPMAPILHKIGRRTSALAAGAITATLGMSSAVAAASSPKPGAFRSEVASVTRVLDRFASSGGGTLKGKITDPQGAVIVGASVTLTNPTTGDQRRTVTADDGQYTFTEVEPGTYKLRIESAGFAASEVTSVEVGATDDNRVDQSLTVAEMMSGAVVIVMPVEPLVKAAMEDDLDAVRAALAERPDPSVRDKQTDSTALDYAVSNGNREIVQALLSARVDLNSRTRDGQTSLMMLTEKVTSDLVWDLIHGGAKVNLRDNDGDTALISVAQVNNVEALKALLDAGAKVNAHNEKGETALMVAANQGYVNNVRALILAGADVNLRDKKGKSALMHAAEADEPAVVRLLKAHGAIEFEVQEKQ